MFTGKSCPSFYFCSDVHLIEPENDGQPPLSFVERSHDGDLREEGALGSSWLLTAENGFIGSL